MLSATKTISNRTTRRIVQEYLKSGHIVRNKPEHYVNHFSVVKPITVFKKVQKYHWECQYWRVEDFCVISLTLDENSDFIIGGDEENGRGKARASRVIVGPPAHKKDAELNFLYSYHSRGSTTRTKYITGEVLYPNDFERSCCTCASGIHFFFSKQQARDYDFT